MMRYENDNPHQNALYSQTTMLHVACQPENLTNFFRHYLYKRVLLWQKFQKYDRINAKFQRSVSGSTEFLKVSV